MNALKYKTLADAYLAGLSTVRIARDIGRGEKLVASILKDSGVTARQGRAAQCKRRGAVRRSSRRRARNRLSLCREVRRLLDGGMSVTGISQSLGVTPQKVRRHLMYFRRRAQ